MYAGTLEIGAEESGRLWRYEGYDRWFDLGNPLGTNIVHSVAEFDGALYCGLGRYMVSGSLLGELRNPTPGGKVYRVDPDGRWEYCGNPDAEGAAPEEGVPTHYNSDRADDVTSLVVYRGNLYCVSNHRHGVCRYEGGENWKPIGPDERLLSLCVFHGDLYALINGGTVYRYEADGEWVLCGRPGNSRQTYSGVICEGRLYVGTWPEGRVYCYEGGESWSDLARQGWVGYECEVMGMVNYNGKVYAGTLPMANVFRMDDGRFSFVANLDASPVQLRRVWTMAVHDGRLFAGTLPSGHVYCVEAGRLATWDRAFPAGWHHVAAVKARDALRIHVDGQEATRSSRFSAHDYDLNNDRPLRIGFGPFDYFNGLMSDVRLYSRPLADDEIRDLALP